MKLVVVSHKLCWLSDDSASGYATDGGFPLQMQTLSELFEKTTLAVPVESRKAVAGTSSLTGNELSILPLSVPGGVGLRRKLNMLSWLLRNGRIIWRAIRSSDAVHVPIPGDVGTIGMVCALIQRKPLFVRHCGNWLAPKTVAERTWKQAMEYIAGGRNVMLATGGHENCPSARNPNVKWIFSTSLSDEQIKNNKPRTLPIDGNLRLIIACRQERNKGTDIVIESIPLILRNFPSAVLDVVGGGSLLENLREKAHRLAVADRVTFHGKVEQAKVVHLLKQSHVFCYPTSASEGFPKVVLEALAAGLPVITTPVSVLPQLLKNDCGVLLDQASPQNLAAAVTSVCSNSDRYRELSENSIHTAQQYSLENWREFIRRELEAAWKLPLQRQADHLSKDAPIAI